jgi:hypothetical protein
MEYYVSLFKILYHDGIKEEKYFFMDKNEWIPVDSSKKYYRTIDRYIKKLYLCTPQKILYGER